MEKLEKNPSLVESIQAVIHSGGDISARGDFSDVSIVDYPEYLEHLQYFFKKMYFIANDKIINSVLVEFGFCLGCAQELLASMGGVDAWWKIYDHLIQENNWKKINETVMTHTELFILQSPGIPNPIPNITMKNPDELPEEIAGKIKLSLTEGLFEGPITNVTAVDRIKFMGQVEHCLHQLVRFCHNKGPTNERFTQIGLQLGRLQYLIPIKSNDVNWVTDKDCNYAWAVLFNSQKDWNMAEKTFKRIIDQLGLKQPSEEFINKL